MKIGYTAVEVRRFTPGSTTQCLPSNLKTGAMKELACLDSMLCPSVVDKFSEEDWKHKIHEFLAHDFFLDLPYLQRRIANLLKESEIQILAVLPDPSLDEISQFRDPDFEFLGYELVDVQTRIDPIINCSTFRELITEAGINQFGLISDYNIAKQLQGKLQEKFRNLEHSETVLFALWKKKGH